MHVDLHDLSHDTAIDADVCIIGAGVAGISLARSLAGTPARVVLLESGGFDYEPGIQDLADGVNEGFDYYPLIDARLRLFGGTTAIWGGRVAALDDIDFESRPWIPYSGWPISRQTLGPWYAQALTSLELSQQPLDEDVVGRELASLPAFDRREVRVAFWRFDPTIGRFAAQECRDLWRAHSVRVITHATVTHIQARPDGRTVESVRISTLDRHQAQVRARYYVLAAGGIENPRLLLAANDVHSGGLGNRHDLVGRFFMEHPHGRGGRVRFKRPLPMLRSLMSRHRIQGDIVAACFRPGEPLQHRCEILNTSFALGCRQHPGQRMKLGKRIYQVAKHELSPTRTNRRLWQLTKRFNGWIREFSDPLRPWILDYLDARGIYAVVRAEQAPNPSSRVLLGRDVDALGIPRARLDWRISELDKRSVRVLMQAYDRELRRLDLGHVDIAEWLLDDSRPWQVDPLISGHPIGGYHHMGTTRMAGDPTRGVVDPDCRVFDLDNLYVTGSSVFPTSGWANPTLTLMALSLRLGAHLHERIQTDTAVACVA